MFLKSLEIYGFKSFADKTVIKFADGITALLGPNGCGKSNVVDAIKWVLAENKSKNLRASTMEDVIFNGTDSRPALSMAEVTLTIANDKGLLPLNDSEIALKRRLYRSGENEYFINGKPVGATMVRKLFMDTGIGKSAYSVMEQGKIDQILSSKPEDRRYLFEEAAGISRSKAEVADAERELEKTRANLAQIDIGLAETKRSYETLKTQAEKTKKYRALHEEKFQEELDIQLLRLKDFTVNKSRNEQELKEATEKRDAAAKEIEEIYSTLNENTDRIKELQEQVSEKQQEVIKLFTEQNGKKELTKQLKEHQRDVADKIGQIENRIKRSQERIDEYNEGIDSLDADLHDKKKKLEEQSANIKGFEENIRQSSGQIEENKRILGDNAEKVKSLAEERIVLQKQLQDITEDIVTELDSKLKDAGYSSQANKKAKEDLDIAIEKIKIFANGRLNIFRDMAALPAPKAEDATKNANDAAEAFEEIGRMLSSLSEVLGEYTRTTPQFIDDFLSPEGIITKKRSIDSSIEENRHLSDSIQEANEELLRTNENLTHKINEYRETLGKLQVIQARMKEQIGATEQQISQTKRSLASEEASLREQQDELFEENKRREEMDEQISDAEEEIAELEEKGNAVTKELAELDRQISECSKNVSGKESALEKKQQERSKWQARLEKLSVTVAQSDTEIRNVKQNFQDNYSRDLMEFEERMYKITASTDELKGKLAATRRKIEELGQVNMMAVEQFDEEKERFERQQASYDDTKKSLENLVRVSEEIRTKSSEMFLATYNKIRRNFHNMFRRLFNGGKAELRLIDPANVLTSGIDILAQPPGKKLQSIALLSGGEKTMTAVALLFATYQVRPSPFCFLDEIDAALDDKNVSSFVQALRSFASISQYVVITHNRKTAVAASSLLGVTMEESGITKVVQVKWNDDLEDHHLVFAEDDDFVEEDVPPEEGIVIPPRPPRREHNPDGSLKLPSNEPSGLTDGSLKIPSNKAQGDLTDEGPEPSDESQSRQGGAGEDNDGTLPADEPDSPGEAVDSLNIAPETAENTNDGTV
ncbi:MAG: AAA family ATPase [Treponema sp.]|nr:AAA family ATPase [Treponema sp.]